MTRARIDYCQLGRWRAGAPVVGSAVPNVWRSDQLLVLVTGDGGRGGFSCFNTLNVAAVHVPSRDLICPCGKGGGLGARWEEGSGRQGDAQC